MGGFDLPGSRKLNVSPFVFFFQKSEAERCRIILCKAVNVMKLSGFVLYHRLIAIFLMFHCLSHLCHFVFKMIKIVSCMKKDKFTSLND